MTEQDISSNKREIYVSSSYIDLVRSNDFKKLIIIPEIKSGEYKYVAVTGVIFPNTILTIQGNGTNELLEVELEVLNRDNNAIETIKKEVFFTEGYYDPDQLLDHLNTRIREECKWSENLYLFEDEQMIQFDENRNDNFLHFKTKVRKNYDKYTLQSIKFKLRK